MVSPESREIPALVRVVDASLEAWAWVEYEVTPRCEVGRVVTRCWGGHEVDSQVEAEANGARAAVASSAKRTILLGLDADSVRYAIEKGYSRSPYLREVLREMCSGPWPWTFRVPGEENIADMDTRPLTRGEWSEEREVRSRARAQAALTAIVRLLQPESRGSVVDFGADSNVSPKRDLCSRSLEGDPARAAATAHTEEDHVNHGAPDALAPTA